MRVVKNSFEWTRPFSAMPGTVHIEAGAHVELEDGRFYVSAAHFASKGMLIETHDASHYGCLVQPDNVVWEEQLPYTQQEAADFYEWQARIKG